MTDAHGGGPDDEPGTAPWERPRRWTPPTAEPTKVDDLLARLGAEETGRRQRRRVENDDSATVSATDLIASLQSAAAPRSSEPDQAHAEGGEEDPDAATAATAAEPGLTSAAATDPGEAPTEVISRADAQAGLPAGPDGVDGSASDTVAYVDDPEATALLPRYAEAAAIRESLTRQAAGIAPVAENAAAEVPEQVAWRRNVPQPPVADPPTPAGERRSPRGFLYAGRSIVAALAALLLVVTGFEYTLLRTTDTALAESSIDALQTDDPNIKTPTRSTATVPAATDAAVAPQVYAPENILLLGSDTRAGDNGDDTNSDASTEGTAQSDTLMIAHISGDRQHITVISIPRDLRVDAPACKAWNADTMEMSEEDFPITEGERWKITNAYAVGGPACTVKAVQQLTGLKIDRVIGIDFLGFKTMVDALDGINVNVCQRIDDAELGLVVAEGGEQVVRGDQALSLVRARKVYGDPTGDFGRIRRQQVVLSSLLRQAISAGTMLNPAKLQNFLEAFVNATYTSNVTVDSMLELAKSFGDLDPSKITFYTLPTGPSGDPEDDALDLDPKAAAVFDALLNDQILPGETPSTVAPTTAASSAPAPSSSSAPPTSASTRSSVITVAPDQVDLEVVNVAGRPGVAGEGMEVLNQVGFAVTDDDLTLPEGEPVYEDVTVLYSPGNEAAALTVATAVPGAVLEIQDGLDNRVRLLLGTSWDGTAQAVSVGQAAPKSLVTAVPGTTVSATSTSSAADSPDDTSDGQGGDGGASTTEPTLGSTDLSSVNAAETLCA